MLDHVAGSGEELEEDRVTQMVAMFVCVAKDYYSHLAGDEHIKKTIERAIGQSLKFLIVKLPRIFLFSDGILQPLFRDNQALSVINEILIQIGILKVLGKTGCTLEIALCDLLVRG